MSKNKKRLTIQSKVRYGQKDGSSGQNVVGIALHKHIKEATVIGFDLVLLQ